MVKSRTKKDLGVRVRARGPRATSPRDKTKITSGDFLNARTHCPFQPHLGSPHSKSTRGTERERGLAPDPDRRSARPGGAGCLREGKSRKNKTAPPGRPPLQVHMRNRGGKGAYPPTQAGEARAPLEGRGVYGRKREKGNYGELQLAVCKRKYEGAELRHGRPKPAAANANSLAYELGPQVPPRPRMGAIISAPGPPDLAADLTCHLYRVTAVIRPSV